MKSTLNKLFNLFERNQNAKVMGEENSHTFGHDTIIGQTY